MWEIIRPYVIDIIIGVLSIIGIYIGNIASKIKNKYEEKINTEMKKKIVEDVVNAVEQLYQDMNGEAKLEKAKECIIDMLNEKGLKITKLELDIMIESVVNGFNQNLRGKKDDEIE